MRNTGTYNFREARSVHGRIPGKSTSHLTESKVLKAHRGLDDVAQTSSLNEK